MSLQSSGYIILMNSVVLVSANTVLVTFNQIIRICFSSRADASADSEVKFHRLVCFAAPVHMMER